MPLPTIAASFRRRSRAPGTYEEQNQFRLGACDHLFQRDAKTSAVYASSRSCSLSELRRHFRGEFVRKCRHTLQSQARSPRSRCLSRFAAPPPAVSKLRCSTPCRSSVMTSIFMARSRALQTSISRPASSRLLSACRQKLGFLGFCRDINFFNLCVVHAKHRTTHASSPRFPSSWPP